MTSSAALAEALSYPVQPIVQSAVVPQAPAEAFRLFTQDLASWWPLKQISAAKDASSCAVEGRVGGRVYEWTEKGAETTWGTVLAWVPARRFAFSWIVGLAPEQAQEVEVTFEPAADGTKVQVVHSGWDSLGAGAEAMRNAYDEGWRYIVECFGAYARAARRP